MNKFRAYILGTNLHLTWFLLMNLRFMSWPSAFLMTTPAAMR
jgi:hypothetical protein